MASTVDWLKWNLYLHKKRVLTIWGLGHGYIFPYDNQLIENLRNVYYGGIPASVLILCQSLCQGYCYDRSVLITLGFGDDDFNILKLGIDGIKLNPEYIDKNKKFPSKDYDSHSVAERIFPDGSRWIYDTSTGLIYNKRLYWIIEKPNIRKINSKQDTLEYVEYQDIKGSDVERDKYSLPFLLPQVEFIVEQSNCAYRNKIKNEIELFKEKIGYDYICQEIYDDMERKGIRKRD